MIGFPFDSHVTYETDGTPVYDRAISSEPLRNLLHKLFTDGILPDVSTNLQVVAGSGMNVVVKAGFAIVQGCLKLEESDRTLALQASSAINDRIDTVVLRLNSNDDQRYCDLYIREGTPATNPTRPNLVRSDSVYELGLADIFVSKTITSITQSKITDTRYEAKRCGVISSLSEFDTTTIYNQVQADLVDFKDSEKADFMNWYQSIVDILNGAIAGNTKLTTEFKLSTSWDKDTANNYYTQSVSAVGIKSTDTPVVGLIRSGDLANIKKQEKEWSKVVDFDTYDGGIRFIASTPTTIELTAIAKPDLSKVTVNNVSSEEIGLDALTEKVNTNTSNIATNANDIASVKSGYFNIDGTEVIFAITNEMKILKCNNDIHFENFESYSEEESIIGTWIDGKPIYRKVMSLTIQEAHKETNFPIFQVEHMVKMQCIVKQAIGNYVSVPYWASSSDYAQLWYRTSESKLVAKCSEANWIYTVVVEYTKPTN